MDYKEIGKRIQELRTNTKTSKEALSGYLGISELDLENIESGEIDSLSSDIVEKLSILYICPPDYILLEEDELKHKVNFDFSKHDSKGLANIAKVFTIIQNQIEMELLRSLDEPCVRKGDCCEKPDVLLEKKKNELLQKVEEWRLAN